MWELQHGTERGLPRRGQSAQAGPQWLRPRAFKFPRICAMLPWPAFDCKSALVGKCVPCTTATKMSTGLKHCRELFDFL